MQAHRRSRAPSPRGMPGSRRPLGCRRRAHRPHSERGRRTRPWSGIVPRHHAFRASSGPADRRTRHAGGRARAAGVRLHSRTRPAVASSRRPAARIVHRPEGARCSMMPGHRSNAGRHRQAGAAGPGRPDARMEDGRQGMSGRVPGRSAAGLGRCVHRRVPAPTVQSGIGMPQHAGKPFMMPIRTGATACPGLREQVQVKPLRMRTPPTSCPASATHATASPGPAASAAAGSSRSAGRTGSPRPCGDHPVNRVVLAAKAPCTALLPYPRMALRSRRCRPVPRQHPRFLDGDGT